MKRMVIALVLAGLWLVPSMAMAQQDTYIAAKIGFHVAPSTHLGVNRVSPDPGLSIMGALGLQLQEPFRVEAELSYLGHHYDGRNRITGAGIEGSYDTLNLMFNGLIDVNRPGPVNPYVGLGVGVSVVNVDRTALGGNTVDDTDAEPALQTILGVEFTPKTTPARIVAEYRYFLSADPEFNFGGATLPTELEAHQFLIGFRYMFP